MGRDDRRRLSQELLKLVSKSVANLSSQTGTDLENAFNLYKEKRSEKMQQFDLDYNKKDILEHAREYLK